MRENSSASTETKPALFGQKPFVVKAELTEGERSDSRVSLGARRLAGRCEHPECLPELLFWVLEKSTGRTQSSPQCSQQIGPSGGRS